MTESVPNWVRRWDKLKLAVGVSAAVSLLAGLLVFTLAIPFVVAEVLVVVYESMGRTLPFDYWTAVAISALFEVAALGYVVIETLAELHRHGITENGGNADQ